MKLAFLDSAPWDYDVATPGVRPMGGSQSGLCYLALALAGRGHEVTLYTGTSNPQTIRGVHCRSHRAISSDAFADCHALIVLNGPAEVCVNLRPHLPRGCRLILWTGHSYDQPALAALRSAETRANWDRIVCVSDWHRTRLMAHFDLNPDRAVVLRNAIAPAFENLFSDIDALAKAKAPDPILTYTSTPFRGLDVLLALYPQLYRSHPRIRLQVYSSMSVYYVATADDPYAALYHQCRSTAGAEYFGAQPQPMLAKSLMPAWILAYPNTFVETSCISVMEAMAAGLLVVTSDQGALAETTMGMGVLVPPPSTAGGPGAFATAYLNCLSDIIRQVDQNRRQFWASRWQQVREVNSRYTWAARALEWEQMLHILTGSV